MIPLRIEKLQRHHAMESFDCGREALNILTQQCINRHREETSRWGTRRCLQTVTGIGHGLN